MSKVPEECYRQCGQDLDGCSGQENEGCTGCRCLIEEIKPETADNKMMEVKFMSNLGKLGKDKITGFQGIIVGKINYLFGCSQYGLAPRALDEGSKIIETNWFDEGRIEIIGDGIAAEKVQTEIPGGINRDCPRHVK